MACMVGQRSKVVEMNKPQWDNPLNLWKRVKINGVWTWVRS